MVKGVLLGRLQDSQRERRTWGPKKEGPSERPRTQKDEVSLGRRDLRVSGSKKGTGKGYKWRIKELRR